MSIGVRVEKSGKGLLQTLTEDAKSVLITLPFALILRYFLLNINFNQKLIDFLSLMVIALPIVIFRIISELCPHFYLKIPKSIQTCRSAIDIQELQSWIVEPSLSRIQLNPQIIILEKVSTTGNSFKYHPDAGYVQIRG